MKERDTKRHEFAEYFTARRDVVRRTAYLLCGDWHWADDLTQVAFVRVANAWDRIRDPVALDAFTRTCLIRAYLSESRRMWRRRERSTDELPETDGRDPGAAVDSRIDLVSAMRALSPRQRATLVCRYYQDLDIDRTAELLGCSPGTVKSQTARALAHLRRLLGARLDLPELDEVPT
jgi:RNA polymerase sigma-70 factor (sigma-E family)